MPVPTWETILLPLLTRAGDGGEHSRRELMDALAAHFQLTDAELDQVLPSGRQTRFDNRVAWALTHLKKAALLEPTRRAYVRITDRGRDVLAAGPAELDAKFLMQFPEYREFAAIGRTDPDPDPRPIDEISPEEAIESAHERLTNTLAADLLAQVKACSPSFFERLVVDLLLKMGYGGTRQDAGEAIGKSGDEGIDGIIKEDRLGLDVIYLQAKRWESTVGRPEIQKFVGALHGQRARKGVFITTSSFTQDALAYAGNVGSKVILVDGATLARLMIDHGVGVTPVASYEIKRLDSDYFTE